MTNINFLSRTIILAGTLLTMLALSPVAKAVPLIIGQGQLGTIESVLRPPITFDAPNGGGCTAPPGVNRSFVRSDNVPGVSLNPTNSCYLSLPRDTSASLTFTETFRAFGFFWGSIDAFNRVLFFRDSRLVFVVNGTQAVQAIQASQGFTGFLFPEADAYNRVVFFTSAPAFELDNIGVGLPFTAPFASDPPAQDDPIYIPYPPRIPPRDPGFTGLGFNFAVEPATFDFTAQAAPVSEPASLALFGAGLAGVGLMAGRRRHTKTA